MSIGISKILSHLESKCSSKLWLILSSGELALYFVVVTIITTWYRWRHYVKYILLRMRMRRERLQTLIGREGQYDFDAFVSCTREGAKWMKKYFLPKLENKATGFKFCIAQRDFIVGKTIIDNIMDSINRSRKTILLVDETFIKSKWCQEELLLSHHVSVRKSGNSPIEINLGNSDNMITINAYLISGVTFTRLQHDHLHFHA